MILTEKQELALYAVCYAATKSKEVKNNALYTRQPQVGAPMQKISYEDALCEVWGLIERNGRERIENAGYKTAAR